MNKVNGLVVAFLLSGVSAVAADWGGKEVKTSTNVALDMLLADAGAAAFDSVSAIETAVSAQKNSAKVKLTYKVGNEKKVLSLFCHTHDTDIDCH